MIPVDADDTTTHDPRQNIYWIQIIVQTPLISESINKLSASSKENTVAFNDDKTGKIMMLSRPPKYPGYITLMSMILTSQPVAIK